MSERVIKDLTEQNRLSSETYWELQTKYEKLESENAALKEIEELLTEDIKAKIVKNKKLLKEVKKLREALKELVEATEYGENQWQAAFSPDKETKGQKSIKKAKEVLKDD